MRTFPIVIEDGFPLRLSPSSGSVGAVKDNGDTELAFTRPAGYEDADLFLRFRSGEDGKIADINLGSENRFVLTETFTQNIKLSLEVYFKAGDIRTHSDRANYTLSEFSEPGVLPPVFAPPEHGRSPYFSRDTATWWEWDDAAREWTDTGVSPGGAAGGALAGVFALEQDSGDLYFVADDGVDNPFLYDAATGELYYNLG